MRLTWLVLVLVVWACAQQQPAPPVKTEPFKVNPELLKGKP